MGKKDLDKILKDHLAYLKDPAEGKRADLRGVDLQYANLQEADLQRADLQKADLRYANLRYADLQKADLRHANLWHANLWHADLRYADLQRADLQKADLRYADLRYADLQGANLQRASLADANLREAKLDYQIQEGLLKQIAEGVLEDNGKLEMDDWHATCGTAHCLAGWACHVNDIAGELEKTHNPEVAGLLTLGAEAHSYFFKENEEVLEWLETVNRVEKQTCQQQPKS